MFIDFSKVNKQADACVAKLKIATPSIQKMPASYQEETNRKSSSENG